jgi:sugar/nucleoside kinase (ribokinase family)
MVGVVGEDFEDAHLADLRSRDIDTAGVEVASGRTFRWSGRYEADWNTRHTLETQLNVFEHFDPKIPPGHRDSRFVFLANAAPAIQKKALEQVDGPTFTMADTMNLWIDVARDDLVELLRHVDALILNDEEARMLTGEHNLLRAAGQVLGMGPRYVVLKKGEHGAFLIGTDVHYALPAYPVEEVVDPTGAGDSFAGGFLGWVARKGDTEPRTMRQAMVYGTVAASFCVEGFSTEGLAARSFDDLEARVDDLRTITTI